MFLAHRSEAASLLLKSLHRAEAANRRTKAEDNSTWTDRVFEDDYLLGFADGINAAAQRFPRAIRYQQGYIDGLVCWDVICETLQKEGQRA